MTSDGEFFVVARNNADAHKPPQVIERFFEKSDGDPGEHLQRAKDRQRQLKFGEGYQACFLYEAAVMRYVDGDFISPFAELSGSETRQCASQQEKPDPLPAPKAWEPELTVPEDDGFGDWLREIGEIE